MRPKANSFFNRLLKLYGNHQEGTRQVPLEIYDQRTQVVEGGGITRRWTHLLRMIGWHMRLVF